ncbi:MAG: Fis family transcriptional regulator [Thermoprotei archaeon]|nr:MAG: Fis family transcriptional regulator [Thermoprotei archaeon]RLF11926.1 MAG: Fis family transcriptional regulator [Thermoprotei archaeon]
MSRFLQALKARLKLTKLGLSHGNDADGITCAALFLRKYPGATVVLAEPWEIKPTWTCWLNWFAWDFVADLPCPFRAKLHVDHHKTGRPCAKVEFYDPEAPSAASLALKALQLESDEEAARLVELANECDTAKIRSQEAWDLNDAVKGSRIEERVTLAKLLAMKGLAALSEPMVKGWIEVNKARRRKVQTLVEKVPIEDFLFIKLREVDEKFPVRTFMLTLEEKGAKLTCVITPRRSRFKVHLGSRRDSGIDCAEIAFKLGGGGHRYAAGATVDNLDEALRRIKEALGLKELKVMELA